MDNAGKGRKALLISRITAAVFFVLFFITAKDITGFDLFYTLPYGLGLCFLPLGVLSLAVGMLAAEKVMPAIVLGALGAGLMLLFINAPDKSPQRITQTLSDGRGEAVISLHDYYKTAQTDDFLTVDVPIIPGVLSKHKVCTVTHSDEPLEEQIEMTETAGGFAVMYGGKQVIYMEF